MLITLKLIGERIFKMQTRECGDCNMCCKLPEIPSINKKSYSWCKNCNIGEGCNIYEKRPEKCKDFVCLYVTGLTDLKPNKCGFFIFPESEQSTTHKIFTIYSEPHKLDSIPKAIMQDNKLSQMVKDNWAFHIRYNSDDNDLAIFDLAAFGMGLKKVKRNNPIFKEAI